MAAENTVPIPFSVNGKTALITGAGSGINLSFATLLLSRNCNVVIADLGLRPEAQRVVDEHSIKAGSKPRAVFIKCDVTVWDDLSKAFDVAGQEFGGADIVCPGAGIYEPHWSNFWRPPGTPPAKDPLHGSNGLGHYATLDICVTHPIRMTQIAISKWLNPVEGSRAGKASLQNPKRVLLISSITAQMDALSIPLYVAAKAAISGFIRTLTHLDAIGIRVNGVAPGIVKTPLWTEHPEKLQVFDEERDQWVEPEEVAQAMLRCLEEKAIGGGYVMEVTKGTTRKVESVGDPGPSGPGTTSSKGHLIGAEVFGLLNEPGWGVPQS